ncbi:uncharacterized protein LOC144163963 [Haemaphysalis longicornis]
MPYAITRALSTICATNYADFLLHAVILHHGVSRQLSTDRGRCFLSQVIDDLLWSCRIRHNLAMAYHTQTNRLAERFNKTLTDTLAMHVSPDHRDCAVSLPYVTFTYNSSRLDTAGFPPFFLLFGRDPTLPLDNMLPDSTTPRTEYARDLIAQADVACQIARANITASQASQKRCYDENHRDVCFQPGFLVLHWQPSHYVGLSERLLLRFTGPYRIIPLVTPVTYEIIPVTPPPSTVQPATQIVHVSRLKP